MAPVVGLILSGVDTFPHPAIGEAADKFVGDKAVRKSHLDATNRSESLDNRRFQPDVNAGEIIFDLGLRIVVVFLGVFYGRCAAESPDRLNVAYHHSNFIRLAVQPPPNIEANYAASMVEWACQTYDGRMDFAAVATIAVGDLLGRKPLTLREWVVRNSKAVSGAGAQPAGPPAAPLPFDPALRARRCSRPSDGLIQGTQNVRLP
jgi:hypothetical protein